MNLRGLVTLECLNQHRLLLEEAHPDGVNRPNFVSAHLYMGEDEELPGVAMSSFLRSRIASELGKEAAILKERWKAKEARGAPGRRKKRDGAPCMELAGLLGEPVRRAPRPKAVIAAV